MTVDNTELLFEPGIRSTAATLKVRLRSSRGGEHAFALRPPGATLERVKINGAAQPLRQDGAAVTVPVAPGASAIELGWRQPGGLALGFRAPEVDLRIASVNASVKIALPADRWVLSVGGPRLGPAVLFWSAIIVMILVGVALARSPWTPLRAHHWILLGVGLVQTSVQAAAVVAGLFLVFGWRRSRPPMWKAWRYDLSQLALAIWTVAAITILARGVGHGLLGYPEMMIAGNGSSSWSSGTLLAWFTDRVSGPLPSPWVVSVPLLVYPSRCWPGRCGSRSPSSAGRAGCGAASPSAASGARWRPRNPPRAPAGGAPAWGSVAGRLTRTGDSGTTAAPCGRCERLRRHRA